MTIPDDRSIPFERWWSVRDLGGLPIEGGGTTKRGVVLRAASPQHATRGDIEEARRLGLRSFVDLRGPLNQPDWRDGVDRVRLVSVDVKGSLALPADVSEGHVLRIFLDERRVEVADAIRAVTDLARQAPPVVFHCHTGKDRTGLIAIVLLELVPVPNASILEDYMASNPPFTAMRDALVDESGGRFMSSAPPAMRGPVIRSSAIEALRFLADAGGVRAYLESGGLTATEIDAASRLMR